MRLRCWYVRLTCGVDGYMGVRNPKADEQYLPFLSANTQNLDAEIVCAIIGSASRGEYAAVPRTSAGSGAIIASARPTKTLALDDVLHGQTPDLIKIDTDGYDLEVLRGATMPTKHWPPPIRRILAISS